MPCEGEECGKIRREDGARLGVSTLLEARAARAGPGATPSEEIKISKFQERQASPLAEHTPPRQQRADQNRKHASQSRV